MMSEVMCLEGLVKRSKKDPDGGKGCVLGHREIAGELLPWICGQFSGGCAGKVQEKNKDDRRRSVEMDGGENPFWGGSDPL